MSTWFVIASACSAEMEKQGLSEIMQLSKLNSELILKVY